jgi:nitrate/TMAO reductase-like tetraheme cytochrome c subunit
MNPDTFPKTDAEHPFSVFRNWISLSGLVLSMSGLFSFFLLLLLDAMAKQSNPYVGILTYMVAPGFIVGGLVIFVFGGWWRRRKIILATGIKPALRVDFSLPRDRKTFAALLGCGIFFLFVSAIGSYQTYHFTESVQFCGQSCHQVMKPELVTYLHGPHSRVSCAECHIGKGAGWFVKSKLSGTYQVYAVAFDKYPRPVPTPVKNLRPAQDTCEQCHWPQKHVGNLERTYNYFLTDPTNTPFTVRMVLKVGGADPNRGPVGGIHYHVANKMEYLATDEKRQKIPYVRVTTQQGVVTEYRTARFTNAVAGTELRKMDCMDCHNRPAHRYMAPNKAVNLAMSLGRISQQIPSIKSNTVFALVQKYSNETQALEGIATHLSRSYPDDTRVPDVITEAQKIYSENFFPEMKANWSEYPENIGHKDWPGCFRCHDGNHQSPDGKKIFASSNCNGCHNIIAQGRGAELMQLTPEGQKFKHPDGETVEGGCNDCHNGGL